MQAKLNNGNSQLQANLAYDKTKGKDPETLLRKRSRKLAL